MNVSIDFSMSMDIEENGYRYILKSRQFMNSEQVDPVVVQYLTR